MQFFYLYEVKYSLVLKACRQQALSKAGSSSTASTVLTVPTFGKLLPSQKNPIRKKEKNHVRFMVSLMSSLSSLISVDSRFDLQDIPLVPNQPTNFAFPKRCFGQTKVVYRSFQPSWFKQWLFLHYETDDGVYCHTCVTGFKEKKNKESSC